MNLRFISLFCCVRDHDDVRGFVSGGYGELSNNEGPLSSLVCEEMINLHLISLIKSLLEKEMSAVTKKKKCLNSRKIQLK